MKRALILIICATTFFVVNTQTVLGQPDSKPALILIDIQKFYFPGGFSELHEPEEAARKAALVLKEFRKKGNLVVHVMHKTDKQMAIHESVQPLKNEKTIVKKEVSCFNGTEIYKYLKENDIVEVVIVGMQTHMCVEAATRAAYDLGFEVKLISDACATKDLIWEGETINWKMVHLSTLSTLKNYAEILDVKTFLERNGH